jgi:RHS repeat-associated protein
MFRNCYSALIRSRLVRTERASVHLAQRRRKLFPVIERLEDRRLLATIEWNSDNNGFWDVASNWSPAVVPGATDDVVINRVSANPTITIRSGANSVRSISSAETIAFTGGSLAVSASSTLSSGLIFNSSSASLVANAPIDILGSSTWIGGTFGGTGAVTNLGSILAQGTGAKVVSGTLINQGTITSVGSEGVGLSGAIQNQATGLYDLQGSASFGGSGRFTNYGTFRKSVSTLEAIPQSFFDNIGGTIDVRTGTLNMRVGNGTSPANSSYQAGLFQVSSGAVLDLTGGRVMDFSGTLTGSGGGVVRMGTGTLKASPAGANLNFPAALFQTNGGTLDGGTVGVNNLGFLNFTGSFGPNLIGTLRNSGSIIQSGAGGAAINGTLINEPSGLYEIRTDSLTGGSGVFQNFGTLRKSQGTGNTSIVGGFSNQGGTIEVTTGTLLMGQVPAPASSYTNGNFVVSAGATLDITGGRLVTATGLLSGSGAGTVRLGGGTLQAGTGGLSLNFPPNMFRWTSGGLSGSTTGITNLGSISLSGTGLKTITGNVLNRGHILQDGLGNLNQNAQLENQLGATIEFAGTAGFSGTGRVINRGTIRKSAGSAETILDSFMDNLGGTIIAQAGTLSLRIGASAFPANGRYEGGEFQVSNGAVIDLAGGRVVDYSGTLSGGGEGTIRITGTLKAAASGAELNFSGNTLSWTSGVIDALSGPLRNSGTMLVNAGGPLTLKGVLNNDGIILHVGVGNIQFENATLNNRAGGVYDLRNTGGLLTQTGANLFSNAGTLRRSAGTGQATINTPVSTTGSIELSAGSLVFSSSTVAINDTGRLSSSAGTVLSLAGNLLGTTNNRDLFENDGRVLLTGFGTTRLVEAMGRDLGNINAGYDDNFAIGSLTAAGGVTIKLVDLADNSPGAGPEALYVNTLIVPGGVTLDLNGLRLYARAFQGGGQVINGTVSLSTDGGSLVLGSPAPGTLSTIGQVDPWTFFGRAGQQVLVTLNTGASGTPTPLSPALNYAQIVLRDPEGNVLASAFNDVTAGVDVSLLSGLLTLEGTYTIEVLAPAGIRSNSTGNYLLRVEDATVRDFDLQLNRSVNGTLANPANVDRWSFSALANEQINFDLLNTSASALRFDLTGPSNWSGFSNLSADSGLITLPAAGTYTLTARSTQGLSGSYAFRVDKTGQTALTPNVPFTGSLTGSGQAQVFRLPISSAQQMLVQLDSVSDAAKNELYIKFGAPPTRSDYQYRYSTAGADQRLVVPTANAGTWYILVYAENVPASTNYSLLARTGSIFLDEVSPKSTSDLIETVLTLDGLGFDNATQVELISGSGQVIVASQVDIDLRTQATAYFPAGSLAAGQYDVRVRSGDGQTAELVEVLNVTNTPIPGFKANLVTPQQIGYRTPSTIYIEYENTGNVPIAAPLLVMTVAQPQFPLSLRIPVEPPRDAWGAAIRLDPNDPRFKSIRLEDLNYKGTLENPLEFNQNALFTLDKNLIVQGSAVAAGPDVSSVTNPNGDLTAQFISSEPPPGFSTTIQVLASGKTPGVLNPGERIQIPVYYTGWRRPLDLTLNDINFTLQSLESDNTSLIDWTPQKSEMRPPLVPQAAWDIAFENLMNQMGAVAGISSTGQYVEFLSRMANYLGRQGIEVRDSNELWGFAMQQAVGFNTISQLASAVDASVDSRALSLSFSRSYSSSLVDRFRSNVLGYGWTVNGGWFRSLRENADGSIEIIDMDGSTRRFQADTRGGFIAQPGDFGKLIDLDGFYELQEQNGMVTRFRVDGRVEYIQDTNTNRITAAYTGNQLTGLVHAGGQSISIAYNAAGRISSVTDQVGKQTTYNYDATNEHLQSTVAYDGRITNYTYGTSSGARHGLISVQSPDGSTQHYEYASNGALSRMYRTGGTEEIEFTYELGTVESTDALGGETKTFFNHRGQISKVVNSFGNATYYEYDSLGQLTKITDAAGQFFTYEYDKNGNAVRTTDPLGSSTTSTYAAAFNRLASVTDARGNSLKYGYDSRGNLASTTYADDSVERQIYDAVGNPTTLTNRRGRSIQVGYDTAGRVLSRTYADGSQLLYEYDVRGNLFRTTDTTGITNLDYDVHDRLTKITYPSGKFLEYTYDAAGRRTRMVDHEGFTVNYSYDTLGRLLELTDANNALVVRYAYNAVGSLSRKDMGNGTYTTYEYDLVGQLLHLINFAPDGSINSRFDYTYDALGRRISMTELGGQWSYTYDAIGQLIRAVFVSNDPLTLPNQDLQYVYDSVGNRIRTILNGVTTEYTTNNLNQYTQVGDTLLSYDLDGNLVLKVDGQEQSSYNFNDENQLVAINVSQDQTTFVYDAFQNRRFRAINGSVSESLFDLPRNSFAVREYGANNTPHLSFYTGIELAASQDELGSKTYYNFDGTGNAVQILLGNMVSPTSSRDPFGFAIGTQINTYEVGFIGEFGVQLVGELYQTKARFYDSQIGRFISADPLALASGEINTYIYAGNSPVSLVDSDGFARKDVGKTAFAIAVGVASIVGGSIAVAAAIGVAPVAVPTIAAASAISAAAGYITLFAGFLAIGGGVGNIGMALSGNSDSPVPTGIGTFVYATGFTNWEESTAKAIDGLFTLMGFFDLAKSLSNKAALEALLTVPGSIESIIYGPPIAQSKSKATTSKDPNQKIGPDGFGDNGYLKPDQPFAYRIDFENDSEATAPAQRVDIEDYLSPLLDWGTFEFTELGFGNQQVIVPAGSRYFETVVPMTYNNKTFDVQIALGFKSSTGRVFARFESIDPNTELPPEVLAGFLPPEDGTGRGLGYIAYNVRPKAGLTTGTQIRNIADITFDLTETIATNQIDPHDPSKGTDPKKEALVTIDVGAPTSTMNTLPLTTSTSQFTVSWIGTDDANGSGIGTYELYMSENGGAYERVLTDLLVNEVLFDGQDGHTYSFYVMAIDNVGNRQALPSNIATTQVALQAATTVAVTSDHTGGSVYGDPVAFTITVGASTANYGHPSGMVQLLVGDQPYNAAIPLTNGAAVLLVDTWSVGSYSITASYTSDNANFADSQTGQPIVQSVSPANLLVSANTQSKIYGSSDPTLTFGVSGFKLTDTPSIITGALSRNSGENVGSYAIALGSISAGANYAVQYTGADLSITSRSLTVTADPKTKTYGDSDPALSYSFGTLVNGDTSSVLSGELTRTTGENVGSYAIAQGSISAGSNYSIEYTGADLSITSRSLTVTADPKTKTYGDSDPALTYSFGTLVNGDTSSVLSGALTRTTGENVGSYTISLGSISAGANYSIVYTGADLTITSRSLTITADPKTKTYGDSDPALSYSFGTLVNGDTSNVLSGELTRTAGENVGSYAIALGSISAGSNYTIDYTGNDLTISPRSLIVTANARTKEYGDADPNFDYIYTPLANGDTASVFSGSLTRVVGEDVGVYAINQGSLAAGSNYTISYIAATLTISVAPLTVTADAKFKLEGQADPLLTYQVSGLKLNDSASAVITGSLSRQSGETAGVYSIERGTLAAGGNYSLIYVGNSLTITGSTTNTPPTVAIATPVDGFMNVTSTFTLTATDSDAADQSGTFEYQIDWGNGTTTTVTGPSTTLVNHTYPDVAADGSYVISVKATDPRGAVSNQVTRSFVVGGWSLLADPMNTDKAILVIVGSQGNDNIRVNLKDDDYYKVKIVDRDDDVRRKGTVHGSVERILVYGYAGNDKITIDDDICEPTEIFGGAGDDQIKGGLGPDIILGETGDDNIWGGDGRDIIVGGLGADRLHGDAQDDILIAGFTMFEASFATTAPSAFGSSATLTHRQHRAALEAILSEWCSNRNYTTRRNNIMGTGTGPRDNGTSYFKISSSSMTQNTVFDDGAVDRLWGDSGTDWFFANNLGDLGNVLDDIRDRTGNETVEDLDRWW